MIETSNETLMDMTLFGSNIKMRNATTADLEASSAKLREHAAKMKEEERRLSALVDVTKTTKKEL